MKNWKIELVKNKFLNKMLGKNYDEKKFILDII